MATGLASRRFGYRREPNPSGVSGSYVLVSATSVPSSPGRLWTTWIHHRVESAPVYPRIGRYGPILPAPCLAVTSGGSPREPITDSGRSTNQHSLSESNPDDPLPHGEPGSALAKNAHTRRSVSVVGDRLPRSIPHSVIRLIPSSCARAAPGSARAAAAWREPACRARSVVAPGGAR